MKNKSSLLLIASAIFLLSGCNPSVDENAETPGQDDTGNNQGSSNVVNQNQLGSEYYRPALDEDGNYKTSKNRGITLNLNSGINISQFEKDLMRLSQDTFPTDDHFMQEGQYLTEELVTSWLGRQSEDNPAGLNPTEASEGDERTPRYLNSVLELDFFEETESGLQLAGLSIGLALNSVDYYPAYQFGPTLEQAISPAAMLEEGKRMANQVTQQIRGIEGLENIPVMIGLYEQSPQDDLAGGVYIAQGMSSDGSSVIESWEALNEDRLIFPLQGSDSTEGNAFANFQSEVEAFFPNISGITGRAHYIDDILDSLSIQIMTQFYGEAEMVSYTQYLKQSATTYLPADIDIEIIVESPDGVEAFLQKSRTETEYFSYVFD